MSECQACAGSGYIEHGDFGGDCPAIHGHPGAMPEAPCKSRCDDCDGTGRVRTEETLEHAYAEGRSDEREQWVPLANLLRAAFHGKQDEGSVTLSLAEVLSLSVALQRAEKGLT
jgi:DnaJ-class molecular chaperone